MLFYAECLISKCPLKNSKIILRLSSSIPNLAFINEQTHHTIIQVNQPKTQTYPTSLESGMVLCNLIFEAGEKIMSAIVIPTVLHKILWHHIVQLAWQQI